MMKLSVSIRYKAYSSGTNRFGPVVDKSEDFVRLNRALKKRLKFLSAS